MSRSIRPGPVIPGRRWKVLRASPATAAKVFRKVQSTAIDGSRALPEAGMAIRSHSVQSLRVLGGPEDRDGTDHTFAFGHPTTRSGTNCLCSSTPRKPPDRRPALASCHDARHDATDIEVIVVR